MASPALLGDLYAAARASALARNTPGTKLQTKIDTDRDAMDALRRLLGDTSIGERRGGGGGADEEEVYATPRGGPDDKELEAGFKKFERFLAKEYAEDAANLQSQLNDITAIRDRLDRDGGSLRRLAYEIDAFGVVTDEDFKSSLAIARTEDSNVLVRFTNTVNFISGRIAHVRSTPGITHEDKAAVLSGIEFNHTHIQDLKAQMTKRLAEFKDDVARAEAEIAAAGDGGREADEILLRAITDRWHTYSALAERAENSFNALRKLRKKIDDEKVDVDLRSDVYRKTVPTFTNELNLLLVVANEKIADAAVLRAVKSAVELAPFKKDLSKSFAAAENKAAFLAGEQELIESATNSANTLMARLGNFARAVTDVKKEHAAAAAGGGDFDVDIDEDGGVDGAGVDVSSDDGPDVDAPVEASSDADEDDDDSEDTTVKDAIARAITVIQEFNLVRAKIDENAETIIKLLDDSVEFGTTQSFLAAADSTKTAVEFVAELKTNIGTTAKNLGIASAKIMTAYESLKLGEEVQQNEKIINGYTNYAKEKNSDLKRFADTAKEVQKDIDEAEGALEKAARELLEIFAGNNSVRSDDAASEVANAANKVIAAFEADDSLLARKLATFLFSKIFTGIETHVAEIRGSQEGFIEAINGRTLVSAYQELKGLPNPDFMGIESSSKKVLAVRTEHFTPFLSFEEIFTLMFDKILAEVSLDTEFPLWAQLYDKFPIDKYGKLQEGWARTLGDGAEVSWDDVRDGPKIGPLVVGDNTVEWQRNPYLFASFIFRDYQNIVAVNELSKFGPATRTYNRNLRVKLNLSRVMFARFPFVGGKENYRTFPWYANIATTSGLEKVYVIPASTFGLRPKVKTVKIKGKLKPFFFHSRAFPSIDDAGSTPLARAVLNNDTAALSRELRRCTSRSAAAAALLSAAESGRTHMLAEFARQHRTLRLPPAAWGAAARAASRAGHTDAERQVHALMTGAAAAAAPAAAAVNSGGRMSDLRDKMIARMGGGGSNWDKALKSLVSGSGGDTYVEFAEALQQALPTPSDKKEAVTLLVPNNFGSVPGANRTDEKSLRNYVLTGGAFESLALAVKRAQPRPVALYSETKRGLLSRKKKRLRGVLVTIDAEASVLAEFAPVGGADERAIMYGTLKPVSVIFGTLSIVTLDELKNRGVAVTSASGASLAADDDDDDDDLATLQSALNEASLVSNATSGGSAAAAALDRLLAHAASGSATDASVHARCTALAETMRSSKSSAAAVARLWSAARPQLVSALARAGSPHDSASMMAVQHIHVLAATA